MYMFGKHLKSPQVPNSPSLLVPQEKSLHMDVMKALKQIRPTLKPTATLIIKYSQVTSETLTNHQAFLFQVH